MRQFHLWGAPRVMEDRGFHEKAFRRRGLAPWDARWHALSPKARTSYLYEVKGATFAAQQGAARSSAPVALFAPEVVRELVDAGLVNLGSATLNGTTRPGFTSKGGGRFCNPVADRGQVPAAHDGLRRHAFQVLRSLLLHHRGVGCHAAVLRQAGVQDYLPTNDLLNLYVNNHRWPGWVAGLLNDPTVTKVLNVLQDAGEPVLLARLPELVPDIAPETSRTALDRLISYLAVFEDLHPQTRDLMVGLLPAVHKSQAGLTVPRERPPLVECPNAREVGPSESLIALDLRESSARDRQRAAQAAARRGSLPEGSGPLR